MPRNSDKLLNFLFYLSKHPCNSMTVSNSVSGIPIFRTSKGNKYWFEKSEFVKWGESQCSTEEEKRLFVRIKVVSRQLKVVSPQLKVASPQLKVVSPQLKVVSPQP